MPFLSFIVGFRNRELERVSLFLNFLNEINDKDFELIFVDYGSDKEVSKNIKNIVSKYSFASYYFLNTCGQNWNRAKCLNYGYKQTKGKFVFTSDIDFLFSKNFISILKELANPIKTYYFKVGFLTENQSKNIHQNTANYNIESYSNEDAIGALFISKELFIELGGYDEFYEIWGVEDNDMLYRLKMTKTSIVFYNTQTLIWHIWHLPVKKTDLLPEGWLKFLNDYYENKFNSHTNNFKNFYCSLDNTRPILANINNCKTFYKVNYNPEFLLIFIKDLLINSKSKEVFCIKFDFENYQKYSDTKLNKLINKINRVFKKFDLSLSLHNINMDKFIYHKKIVDCLQYSIKYNHELINDYYLDSDLVNNGFFIMKK